MCVVCYWGTGLVGSSVSIPRSETEGGIWERHAGGVSQKWICHTCTVVRLMLCSNRISPSSNLSVLHEGSPRFQVLLKCITKCQIFWTRILLLTLCQPNGLSIKYPPLTRRFKHLECSTPQHTLRAGIHVPTKSVSVLVAISVVLMIFM
jgi:hypothetical protein